MKKTLIALLCAAAIPAAAWASSDDHRGRPDRAERMERMAQRLQLTDEQRAAMETLFEEQRAEREAMRDRMRSRMAEVRTPEQRTRMDEMREERRERWREKRHDGRHGHRGDCDHERGEERERS